jgi:hypothetical protein
MARAYSGAAGTHMVLGLLSMAAGTAFLCLMYFYEPLFYTNPSTNERGSLLQSMPAWAVVLLSGKIICGFWFFLTGAVGCAITSRGCTEGVWVALNVLNVIIWVPILLLLMAGLTVIIIALPGLLAEAGMDDEQLVDLFLKHSWLWVFPGVGALVGVIEFILSIVSYSIVCCCRPESLDEGYEYQYEMK